MSIWDPEYRAQKAATKKTLIRSGSLMYKFSIVAFGGLTAFLAVSAGVEIYAARKLDQKKGETAQEAREASDDRSNAHLLGRLAELMAAGTVVSVRAQKKDRETINKMFP